MLSILAPEMTQQVLVGCVLTHQMGQQIGHRALPSKNCYSEKARWICDASPSGRANQELGEILQPARLTEAGGDIEATLKKRTSSEAQR